MQKCEKCGNYFSEKVLKIHKKECKGKEIILEKKYIISEKENKEKIKEYHTGNGWYFIDDKKVRKEEALKILENMEVE